MDDLLSFVVNPSKEGIHHMDVNVQQYLLDIYVKSMIENTYQNESFNVIKSYVEDQLTIVTWNINSIRARIIDEFTNTTAPKTRDLNPDSALGIILEKLHPSFICLQETKLPQKQHIFGEIAKKNGYNAYFVSSSGSRAYSGVAIWVREDIEVGKIHDKLPGLSEELQEEGRFIAIEYKNYLIINTYVPNTQRAGGPIRGDIESTKYYYIERRLLWDKCMNSLISEYQQKGKEIIWIGDLNVSRSLMDIYHGEKTKYLLDSDPGSSTLKKRYKLAVDYEKNGGDAAFRLEERRGIEDIIEGNQLIDMYRERYPASYGFTYWDLRSGMFKYDNGLRIDYCLVSNSTSKNNIYCNVLKNIGRKPNLPPSSDHAPLFSIFSMQ